LKEAIANERITQTERGRQAQYSHSQAFLTCPQEMALIPWRRNHVDIFNKDLASISSIFLIQEGS
jgi:hypothetical protein